jgi:hypothetical protein
MVRRPGQLLYGLIGLIAGCTPATWTHPQLGTSRLAQDEHECTVIARQEAWRADTGGGTIVGRHREFPTSALDNDLDFAGSQPLDLPLRLRDTCMRAKGYTLTP